MASISVTSGAHEPPLVETGRNEGRPWHKAAVSARSGEMLFGRSDVFLIREGMVSRWSGILAPLRPCEELPALLFS